MKTAHRKTAAAKRSRRWQADPRAVLRLIARTEPFTPAEDDAVTQGLTGAPTQDQQTVYFGLVGTNTLNGGDGPRAVILKKAVEFGPAEAWMNERAAREGRENDRPIIDLMLAHMPEGVEAAYNRAAFMPRRRELAQAWADLLLEGLPDIP